MNNFALINDVILLSATLVIAYVFILFLQKVVNNYVIKRSAPEWTNGDYVVKASFTFSFLILMATAVDPLNQVINQMKYSTFNSAFTYQAIQAGLSFLFCIVVAIAVITIIVQLILGDQIAPSDSNMLGKGIFYGLTLVGLSYLTSLYLSNLFPVFIEFNTVPLIH